MLPEADVRDMLERYEKLRDETGNKIAKSQTKWAEATNNSTLMDLRFCQIINVEIALLKQILEIKREPRKP